VIVSVQGEDYGSYIETANKPNKIPGFQAPEVVARSHTSRYIYTFDVPASTEMHGDTRPHTLYPIIEPLTRRLSSSSGGVPCPRHSHEDHPSLT